MTGRVGSGVLTDATNTATRIIYAGESRNTKFEVFDGEGHTKTQKNLTGYSTSVSAIAVEVKNNSILTATPLGVCTVSGSSNTIRSKEACNASEGTWVQNTPVQLPVNNTNLSIGEFSSYARKTILNTVGFTDMPEPGAPLYVAFEGSYKETTGSTPQEIIVGVNIRGYRWSPMFDINVSDWTSGTTYAVDDLVLSPTDNKTYKNIVTTSGTTDPSSDSTNWVLIG